MKPTFRAIPITEETIEQRKKHSRILFDAKERALDRGDYSAYLRIAKTMRVLSI